MFFFYIVLTLREGVAPPYMAEVSPEYNGYVPNAPILNLGETNNVQCNNYGSIECC